MEQFKKIVDELHSECDIPYIYKILYSSVNGYENFSFIPKAFQESALYIKEHAFPGLSFGTEKNLRDQFELTRKYRNSVVVPLVATDYKTEHHFLSVYLGEQTLEERKEPFKFEKEPDTTDRIYFISCVRKLDSEGNNLPYKYDKKQFERQSKHYDRLTRNRIMLMSLPDAWIMLLEYLRRERQRVSCTPRKKSILYAPKGSKFHHTFEISAGDESDSDSDESDKIPAMIELDLNELSLSDSDSE